MREIKFRGKSDLFGWVYGSYAVIDSSCHIFEEKDLTEDGHHIRQDSDRPTWVDPNTIGQYTGLKDKNGKEIYEGDLVKSSFSNKVFGMIAWNTNGYFYIMESLYINEDYEEQDRRPLGEMLKLSIENKPCNFTVIGNIHDNPELIEK